MLTVLGSKVADNILYFILNAHIEIFDPVRIYRFKGKFKLIEYHIFWDNFEFNGSDKEKIYKTY